MSDILRIGIVSNVKPDDRTVRVRFEEENTTSGWLKVIKSPASVTAKATATTDTKVSGGESSEEIPQNNISVDVDVSVDVETETAPWFPAVGETVLCMYNPGFNEDGFVIGGL